ncbi:MAG TPA: class I SAM-dependent methyltransferase, partial [Flavobacterium sp.]|nr:class I SAM-dependent methyltransferase [Flavobacterium sp.]
MLHTIKSYLKFLWKSTNAHGVHSPFVFSLVTRCFYDKTFKPEYALLKEYRQALLANRGIINVTDFGAGSKVFKSNSRAISKIAENAGIPLKRARLLFRLARYFKPETVLEIGTSLGLATSALALGCPEAEIASLEGCGETAGIAQKQLQEYKCDARVIVTEFEDYLKSLLPTVRYQLVYFDGNHSKEATLSYFELLLPTISNETVWIFDDIHWSPEMIDAWSCIKEHPKARVTIDTFHWGIVFFRREQEK